MTDWIGDRRGLSPVVGGALMLVIVALLGAVVATMTLGLADTLADPAPAIFNEESIDVALQGNDTDNTLEFAHRGGQSVPAGALVATVGDENGATTIRLGESSAERSMTGPGAPASASDWTSTSRPSATGAATACRSD